MANKSVQNQHAELKSKKEMYISNAQEQRLVKAFRSLISQEEKDRKLWLMEYSAKADRALRIPQIKEGIV